MKRNILAEILKRLRDAGWLSQDKAKVDPDELVKEAFDEEDSALMRGAQLMNLIEFGRTVHAEVAALLDAARRGVAVDRESTRLNSSHHSISYAVFCLK